MYGIYENGVVIAKFVAPTTLRSNQAIAVSDTLSLKRYVSRHNAQRWEIETSLEPLVSASNNLMVSLIAKGSTETVQVLTPQNYGVILARKISSAKASGAVFDSSVTVSSHSGFMPKGTFIRFENHSKIYMTTTDLNGTGAVGIYPPLRVSCTNTNFSNGDNVIMNCLYDTDVVKGMVFSDGIQMDVGTVKLIERL